MSLSQSHAAPPHRAPEHIEGVHLSMARFQSLFELASQRESRIAWSEPLITVDLSQISARGIAEVKFDAVASAQTLEGELATRWSDLVPASVHPLSVWLNGVAQPPQRRGSFHAIQVPTLRGESGVIPQRLKLSYPVRLTRLSSGAWSGIIALPPIANADVKLIGANRAHLIPQLSPDSAGISREVSLRGALAVLIPATEGGQLLQREDLSVTLHESGEGADVQLRLETLLRGEASQAWVRLAPAREALISAQLDGAPAVTSVADDWHVVWVEGSGQHNISATIRVRVDRSSGQPQLSLSPQRAPRAKLSLTLPGEREVNTTPPLPLSSEVRDAQPGERVAPNPQEADEHQGKVTTVSADLPPLQHLKVSWTERRVTPEREAPEFLSETYQLFSLQEGLLKGEARVELDVIKGELKRLEFEVPPEVVLYHLSGAGVEGWVTLPADAQASPKDPRRVRVTFGEPRRGESALSVKWQRVLSAQKPINMPLIRPLNAFQESGVIALYDGDRVGFTPAKAGATSDGSERLIPVGQESIPQHILQLKAGEKVSQAFRHVQAPTSLKTSTTTERARELRFDAQLDTLYTLRDGAVRAQAQLLLNLKSGRLDSLVVALPSACSEPQISGPSINRVEALPNASGDTAALKRYQIRFTRRLEGAITLDIDTEQLVSDASAQLLFPRLIVEGAELTQGHLGLSAESGLEVTPVELKELRRVNLEDLPRSVRLRAAQEVLYGYRFSRDWSMSAKLKRHKIIETLSAEVTSLRLESYLLQSGQRVDLAQYTVKNRDRRAVKIKLPEGAVAQEVLVNGSRVSARAEGDSMSVPISPNRSAEISIRYEFTQAPSESRHFTLTSPTSDMRTANIQWDLFFSRDQQLWSWDGDLHERDRYNAPTLSFPEVTRHAHFTYDLMAASRAPLKLDVTLREVFSIEVVSRLEAFAWIALFLIGLLRGLAFAGRGRPISRYIELGSVALAVSHIGLTLYQGTWVSFERFLIQGVIFTVCIAAVVFGAVRVFEVIQRWRATQQANKLAWSQVRQAQAQTHAHPQPEQTLAPEDESNDKSGDESGDES